MKISIDKPRCQGHAMCTSEAPDLFDLADHDGLAYVRRQPIGPDEAESARAAERACPSSAIVIESGS